MSVENLSGIQWSMFQAMERLAERDALKTLHGTGYTDCFRMLHIDTQIIELDENGKPKENLMPKKDSKGNILTDKNGNPVMQQVDIVIIKGETIPNKVNWGNFMQWLKEEDPVWFCDFVDGRVVPNGNKDRLKNELRKWEMIHRKGANKGKASILGHPKQKKIFEQYLDFTVTHWTTINKHKKMSAEGWGFADHWVYQEMSRIINFNKTEIPEMYKSVHSCLDANLNLLIHEKVNMAITETCNQIGIPLTDEQTDQFVQEVSQRRAFRNPERSSSVHGKVRSDKVNKGQKRAAFR